MKQKVSSKTVREEKKIYFRVKPSSATLVFPYLQLSINPIVCVCRYDAYKKAQAARLAEQGIPLPSAWYRLSYFHCSLFGYFLGLLTATISSEVPTTA